ncbi:hypothetical protein BC938DRAFT_477102 [Jimgerdemannia flammicorona]|uniref:Uncharacterized protein n=1 Tax=Jimgerdemannia flammicorona TaxID=994334 RepID=A0A433QPS6_9FUNG|nr:hypothetical protein BC938DRAFT_477102 [Jimgerdemannia flammicorona]
MAIIYILCPVLVPFIAQALRNGHHLVSKTLDIFYGLLCENKRGVLVDVMLKSDETPRDVITAFASSLMEP